MYSNVSSNKKTILIFARYYLPGFKAGGPIRSLENLIEQLGNENNFCVITSDRDIGDDCSYSKIIVNNWQKIGKAKVFYTTPTYLDFRRICQLVQECNPDYIYLNSFFDVSFTIKPLLLWRFGVFSRDIRVILATRGELAFGALSIKRFKKRIYLFLSKAVGLYRGIIWQASSPHEFEDIKRIASSTADVRIAPNLSSVNNNILKNTYKYHKGSVLNIVCVARIARNKNIHKALKILSNVHCRVEYHIYGPIEDLLYWKECEEIIESLSTNIKVFYRGQIAHEKINLILSKYDLFFLPTAGENFGHAIFEALRARVPVLISNLTPWQDLEQKGIGWDVDLDNEMQFSGVIEECASMTEQQYEVIRLNIDKFIRVFCNDRRALADNQALFL